MQYRRAIRQSTSVGAALLILCGSMGCRPSPPATSSAEPAAAKEDREFWDVSFAQGKKIGFIHTRISHLQEKNEKLVRIEAQHEMDVLRQGEPIHARVTQVSVETPTGALVRFESQMAAGENQSVSSGFVTGDSLRIESKSLGTVVQQDIAWDARWGGPFAADQSLQRRPLRPGETRKLRALYPIANSAADITLRAIRFESTELLDKSTPELLRIEAEVRLDTTALKQVLWTDKQGTVLKSFSPHIGETTYRTTREIATRPPEQGEVFDLAINTTISLKQKLRFAHQTKRVVYRATVRSDDPTELFWNGGSQAVRRLDARSVELTVTALRPDTPLAQPSADAPDEKDLASNSLIQTDDPRITELARQIATQGDDPWADALAIEKQVHGLIRKKNYSQMFASAAEVARSLEGDCTEHSVLVAALCRAHKIPARVVIGLVYFEPGGKPSFGYHMWNEVWIKDRWIAIDATLGNGGIGGAHLKLQHSNLDGVAAYAALLPVVKVLGQLELEIVSAE